MEALPLRGPLLRIVLWGAVAAFSIPVALPSIFLVTWAIFGTETVGVFSSHFSFVWFRNVLGNPAWQGSLAYSLILATLTAGAGCAVLTIHFFYLRRVSQVIEHLTYGAVLFPAIIPAAIYALALRLFGAAAGLPEQLLLAAGHLVFVLPVQYFVFEALQEGIHQEMMEAATTLGASPFRSLRVVFLPAVSSAVRTSFLVGFFFSFDEIVVAAFIIDSPLVTIPKKLWDEVQRNMDPAPAVISTIILLTYMATFITLALARVTRRWATH